MNKNILIYGLAITLISLIFASTAIYKNSQKTTNFVGNLLFPESYNQALKITKIAITTPQKHITMHLDNNFWRVEEADNYYAGLVITNALFVSLNEAEIKAAPQLTPQQFSETFLGNPAKQEKNAGTLIETYTENGKKIESIIIGNYKNNFQYARQPDSSTIWLVSGDFDLPSQCYSWLQQPLLSLNPNSVEKLIISKGDNVQGAIRQEDKSFRNLQGEKANPKPFFETLVNLMFRDVMPETKFNNENTSKQTNIEITTETGLIYKINIMKNKEEYWATVKNFTTSLPTKAASDYIKESSFLIDGWIFKLRPEIGKQLLNYEIGSSKIYVNSIN